jgi:hypothetical protein
VSHGFAGDLSALARLAAALNPFALNAPGLVLADPREDRNSLFSYTIARMPSISQGRVWPVVAAVAAVLAIAAPIVALVALSRPTTATPAEATTTAATPIYTATEIEEATQAVCYAWRLGTESIERASTRGHRPTRTWRHNA